MLTLLLILGVAVAPPTAVDAQPRGIAKIGAFLDQCPDRDPAYEIITRDFEIRRNGQRVTLPACTEPVSTLAIAQYTDELIILQGLRVMYYMDRGQAGHLPWTDGTLYDWMKTRLAGFDIVDGTAGGWCCKRFGGRNFMVLGPADVLNRDFDRRWRGIAGNIDFYAHEARHVDGFPHTSCCGIPGGCDQSFDPANLSAYGVQWWLNKLWLDGTINVGYACLSPPEVQLTNSWFLSGANSQYRGRFCTDPPAAVTLPSIPGGACGAGTARRRAARH